MIQIVCADEKISYTAYHLVKAFFPQEDARITVSGELLKQSETTQEPAVKKVRIRAEDGQGLLIKAESPETFYELLRQHTGRELPWGMLTGVRPVKLAASWISAHIGQYASCEDAKADFIRSFREERFVSPEKAAVAFDIAYRERTILQKQGLSREGASLYVGIPFCPSVCRYCSFSSGPIDHYKEKVDDYLQVLIREMKNQKEAYFTEDNCPDTIYVGGGTPTALSETQLRLLLDAIEHVFAVRQGIKEHQIKEYTVEAGRPDSISREKLRILKEYGVNRISVNPQTMNQKTLDIIGRAHTPEQTREAFYLAREEGFDNINMDLIMGLPGETSADVQKTLEQVGQLGPDSLTVHTLAIKRASAMGIERRLQREEAVNFADDVQAMIMDAYQKALSMGMEPYYLYRQKMISGNFENIGYALPGKEGLYNILIMEEIQSIIGCGAGASTKIIWDEAVADPARGGKMRQITRQENVKNIEEYIRRGSC